MSIRRRYKSRELDEVIEKIHELNITYSEGAKRFGVPVNSIYERNRTRKKINLESTCESEQPGSTGKAGESSSLPEGVEQLIVKYREENPDHGYKRIEDWLKYKHLIVVPRKHIRGVLKRHNKLIEHDSSFDKSEEPRKGERRFEAPYPRDLYQMDVTYVYIPDYSSELYLINVLDDYSRFCVASQLCRDQSADMLLQVLHHTITRYGKPAKLLTDQGPAFYSWSMRQTKFQQYMDDMKIEHIVAEPHSPQTLGKVERFHQSLKSELFRKRRFLSFGEAVEAIRDYITMYNYERCHQGIGGARPADRFFSVDSERMRLEADLASKSIDLSRGYFICKYNDHTISVSTSSEELRVYVDGVLLTPQKEKRSNDK